MGLVFLIALRIKASHSLRCAPSSFERTIHDQLFLQYGHMIIDTFSEGLAAAGYQKVFAVKDKGFVP